MTYQLTHAADFDTDRRFVAALRERFPEIARRKALRVVSEEITPELRSLCEEYGVEFREWR